MALENCSDASGQVEKQAFIGYLRLKFEQEMLAQASFIVNCQNLNAVFRFLRHFLTSTWMEMDLSP